MSALNLATTLHGQGSRLPPLTLQDPCKPVERFINSYAKACNLKTNTLIAFVIGIILLVALPLFGMSAPDNTRLQTALLATECTILAALMGVAIHYSVRFRELYSATTLTTQLFESLYLLTMHPSTKGRELEPYLKNIFMSLSSKEWTRFICYFEEHTCGVEKGALMVFLRECHPNFDSFQQKLDLKTLCHRLNLPVTEALIEELYQYSQIKDSSSPLLERCKEWDLNKRKVLLAILRRDSNINAALTAALYENAPRTMFSIEFGREVAVLAQDLPCASEALATRETPSKLSTMKPVNHFLKQLLLLTILGACLSLGGLDLGLHQALSDTDFMKRALFGGVGPFSVIDLTLALSFSALVFAMVHHYTLNYAKAYATSSGNALFLAGQEELEKNTLAPTRPERELKKADSRGLGRDPRASLLLRSDSKCKNTDLSRLFLQKRTP